MTLLGFLLLVAGLWAVGIAFALAVNKVGSGDPLPPPGLPRMTPYRDEADVLLEGVEPWTAQELVRAVERDHPRERRVRLRYAGAEYEVRRGWRRTRVRKIGG